MVKGKLTLEAVNQRLSVASVGVALRQKGNRLYLRATLPPRPSSSKTKPHQQEIALGIYANPAGFERAEAEARKLGALMACKEFEWSLYLSKGSTPTEETFGAWIERFKQHCLSTNLQSENPQVAEAKWRERYYKPALKWLPEDVELSTAVVITVAQRNKPNTRSRQMACYVLQQFARFAGLDVDLKPYVGNYSSSKAVRQIPSDEQIIQSNLFKNRPWQCLYGLMATYGLRNHEVFFTRFEWMDGREGQVLVAKVDDGKTGTREVYPFYPEWVDLWHLWDVELPKITGVLHKTYGERVARAFQRAGIPFAPYNLRHAYAIRVSVIFKLPVPIAAAMMGHSPTVHWKTYNRWINQEHRQRVYEEMLQSKQRPVAPLG